MKTFYILIGIFFALSVWFRIKSLKSAKKIVEQMKNMSPDFFRQKRAKMLPKDYIKWLNKFYTLIGTEALERKYKGFKIEPYQINALVLMEKEMEDVNTGMGAKINLGRKISDMLVGE